MDRSLENVRLIKQVDHTVAKKILIIGAGITGLTAAVRLVAQGYNVTVVEASSTVEDWPAR